VVQWYGSCVYGNEPSGCIRDREFLEWLSECTFLKRNSPRWSWLVSAPESDPADSLLVLFGPFRKTPRICLKFGHHGFPAHVCGVGGCTVMVKKIIEVEMLTDLHFSAPLPPTQNMNNLILECRLSVRLASA
jgi:hypothetical protein